MTVETKAVADLVERMRSKHQHGAAHRQQAMAVDIDDLRAIVLMGEGWLRAVASIEEIKALTVDPRPPFAYSILDNGGLVVEDGDFLQDLTTAKECREFLDKSFADCAPHRIVALHLAGTYAG